MGKAAIKEQSPKVGIFWIDIDNRKLECVFPDPVISIPVNPGEEYISGDYAHVTLWDNLRSLNLIPDKWRDKEYEYVPRGRVTYDVKRDKYYVYASKKIVKKKWFQDRIISEFSLPRHNTVFKSDLHYEDPSEFR